MTRSVMARLGKQKKAREWFVMPVAGSDQLIAQTDGAIGMFNFRTGVGVLCQRGGYFPHLRIAKPYSFPAGFVHDCLRECPSVGGSEALGDGLLIADNAVTPID